MKLTILWNSEEEGTAVFKRFGKEICSFQIYAVDEDEAELSFSISEISKNISEKVIFKMIKRIKRLCRALKKEGFFTCTFTAEAGSFSEQVLMEIERSTGVVKKIHSEYMLKRMPEPLENSASEKTAAVFMEENRAADTSAVTEQKLSILQQENEIRCVWNGEEDLFSCKLKPYRDGYYIYEVIVREEMRNQGIGTAAMKELLEKEEFLGTMYLQVGSYNERAVHLYRKLGFETETELCYYRMKEA